MSKALTAIFCLWLSYTAWSNSSIETTEPVDLFAGSVIRDYLLKNEEYDAITKINAWGKISHHYFTAITNYGETINNYFGKHPLK